MFDNLKYMAKTYRPVVGRFVWNVTHLFSKQLNPYVINGQGGLEPVERKAYQDIGHSFKDLFVEGGRVFLGLGGEK